MTEVFKILSSSNEAVEIVRESPSFQPPFIETYTTLGDYGWMRFQKIKLFDTVIWLSQYIMKYETVFYAEVPDPILEAHITLNNRMVQSLGRKSNTILDDREFNITYAPFMQNRVLFPAGGAYTTFDVHPSATLLEKWAVDFPLLDRFLNKKLQGPQHAIQLFGQRSFIDPEMRYVVNNVLKHIAGSDASRALTEALALELLAFFLLRSGSPAVSAERHHNRHAEKLLHARKIIEYEADNYDSEDLLSTDIQIADRVGLSLYQLRTGFKRTFGINTYRMSKEIRLQKAQRLLKDTGYSVLDIALQTGFRTQEGLIKAYKSFFRITPSMERIK